MKGRRDIWGTEKMTEGGGQAMGKMRGWGKEREIWGSNSEATGNWVLMKRRGPERRNGGERGWVVVWRDRAMKRKEKQIWGEWVRETRKKENGKNSCGKVIKGSTQLGKEERGDDGRCKKKVGDRWGGRRGVIS